jgi:hypothetical protein
MEKHTCLERRLKTHLRRVLTGGAFARRLFLLFFCSLGERNADAALGQQRAAAWQLRRAKAAAAQGEPKVVAALRVNALIF